MPDFNRLRKALLLQGEPDRVPLLELNVVRDVRSAFLGRPVQDLESEVEFWATAGYEHVPMSVGFRTLLRQANVHLAGAGETGLGGKKAILHSASARYSVYTEELQEKQWAEEGQGLITTAEDFESFPWPDPAELDLALLADLGGHLLPGMKSIAAVGYIFTSAWWLMGFDNFCHALKKNPGLVARVFDRVGSIQYEVARMAASMDSVGAIWMNDDIAYSHALMVAPRYLRQYLFPWYREIGKLCRERGLPLLYHSDGNVTEVLDDLIDCGYNALHPIEPKAMDIAEVKKQVGHKLCLCGNLDLGYTLTLGTPEEVVAEVKQRLREVAPGGGYCAGSSNSVTEYVPLANFNAMRETVLEYGRYPISIP